MSKSAVKIVDDSSYAITADWGTCIGCQSCVRACSQVAGMDVYSTVKVGIPPFVNKRLPQRKYSNIVKLDLENVHINDDKDRVQISNSNCDGCGQCGLVCPVSAIRPYDGDLDDVLAVLRAKRQGSAAARAVKCVAFVAPSVRVGIAEPAGLPAGTSVPRQLANALRACGFDYVFDVDWGADLTTIVDTEDVIKARESGHNRPVFTSCCPGWINMAENKYPWLFDHISRACSCVEMAARCVRKYLGERMREERRKAEEESRREETSTAVLSASASGPSSATEKSEIKKKNQEEPCCDEDDIFIVDIMPCTAKKQEARRIEQTHRDRRSGMVKRNIDACLTVPETYELIKELSPDHLPFDKRDDSEYPEMDSPMAIHMTSTGSTQYARTAGVAENVLRQLSLMKCGDPMAIYETLVVKKVWQPFKDNEHIGIISMNCIVDGEEYNALVAKGGVACIKAVEMLKDKLLDDIDVVEMMACPGGCLGGGGMPKVKPSEFNKVLNARINGIQKLDHQVSSYDGRVGGQNKHQQKFIEEHLTTEEIMRRATQTRYVSWDERTEKHPPPPSPIEGSTIGGLC